MGLILNDVSNFIVDCEHKTAPIQEFGYPSIRTPNVGKGYLILDGVNRVSEEVYRAWTQRGEPQEGDLIIAREAPVGNVAIVPKDLRVCLGQRTVLVRPDRSIVDTKYLCYLLLGEELQGQILTKTTGATVAHLNMKDIRELKLPKLPPLPIQRTIASILSAYDDLIENNKQRIKLLEQMAEEIYKEWFVRMRFPGYETAKFVDGLPEGWSLRSIFEISSVTYGFPFDSSGFTEEVDGMPVIRIRDIRNNCSKTYSLQDADDKYLVENGDLLVGMDGDFHVGIWAGNQAYLNQRVVRFRPLKGIGSYFIFWSFKSKIDYLDKVITGTTVAHLSDKDLRKIQIRMPRKELLELFRKLTDQMYDLRIQLELKNHLLQQTRDLLLPRLMSGKLSVEHLAEQAEEGLSMAAEPRVNYLRSAETIGVPVSDNFRRK